jgi:hypothetical protein
MILRASLLFFVMVSALAGMFFSNNKVNTVSAKTEEEKSIPELIGWSPGSQILAKEMMAKYGVPGEFTESMLIWKNNGEWKKTILFKDRVRHDFPMPHEDVLEQTINYRVPEEKLDELSKFNGSITASRTNGTLTVRCGNENLNMLSLNLADEIIKSKITVSEARLEFYKNAAAIIKGRIPESGQCLFFESDANAADPR